MDDNQNPLDEEFDDQAEETKSGWLRSIQGRSNQWVEQSKQMAANLGQTAQQSTQNMQRRLGEDYYAIIENEPVIQETFVLEDLLYENSILLKTVHNVHWSQVLFWGTNADLFARNETQIARITDKLFHTGPGHTRYFDEINKFMDIERGRGHRLKHGHSIEYLPQMIQKFGVKSIPGYILHLSQDFMSVDGIPLVQNSWDTKRLIEGIGVSKKVATKLVSLSFARSLPMLSMTIGALYIWQAVDIQRRAKPYLETAQLAGEHRDYTAATDNYKRALEIERNPAILIDLGNIYLQRERTWFRAHQTYREALNLLSDNPTQTVINGEAKLSLRGMVGLMSLSTADVLSEMHPEYYNEHVQDLVNATVFSFSQTASELKSSNPLATPPHFSSAINYYLAAKAACSYPFADERRETVLFNLKQALEALGFVAQYDEDNLHEPITVVKHLWANELVLPDELETELGNYL